MHRSSAPRETGGDMPTAFPSLWDRSAPSQVQKHPLSVALRVCNLDLPRGWLGTRSLAELLDGPPKMAISTRLRVS